ncbi:hypothetical protein [Actinorhabdospora filicis]|nr:hypothetical protein [Actinorhabdospora filicis]
MDRSRRRPRQKHIHAPMTRAAITGVLAGVARAVTDWLLDQLTAGG